MTRPQEVHARRRGQAIVEFGMVVLLFVLLISGVFDFGMLLNVRMSVSSLSRELARSASVGADQPALATQANQSRILGVTFDTFSGYCCDPTSALEVQVAYFRQDCPSNCADQGQSNADAGDRVQVSVIAHGAEVLTPLVRPIFGCTDGSAPHCFRDLSAQTTMRYEGP